MLDEKDQMILRELGKNSRKSLSFLSKRTGIPRTTILNRMRRMEKKGVIKKFTVLPNYSALGMPTTAFILVSFLPGFEVKQRELAQRISELEGVFEVHLISGEWDILLKVRAESMEKIGELVIDKLREIEGVGRTVTCGCFSTVKEGV
ncbi:MAG: Lrp/AsnC family transcriptional regulator [Candidatus Methanofastidiosia archaeon]